MFAPWCLLFFKLNSRQENGSKFLFRTKIITKYFLERFLSICGQKMSKGFKNLYIKPDTRSNHCLKSYSINYARLHETRKIKKRKNINYNNYFKRPVEMQLLKAIK